MDDLPSADSAVATVRRGGPNAPWPFRAGATPAPPEDTDSARKGRA